MTGVDDLSDAIRMQGSLAMCELVVDLVPWAEQQFSNCKWEKPQEQSLDQVRRSGAASRPGREHT